MWSSRCWARCTQRRDSRASSGARTASEMSTHSGMPNSSTATTGAASPTNRPTPTSTSHSSASVVAAVANRRVHASGLVRPRISRPWGPTATATAVIAGAHQKAPLSTTPTAAPSASTRLFRSSSHQRRAKRDVRPTP